MFEGKDYNTMIKERFVSGRCGNCKIKIVIKQILLNPQEILLYLKEMTQGVQTREWSL